MDMTSSEIQEMIKTNSMIISKLKKENEKLYVKLQEQINIENGQLKLEDL